MISFLQLYTPWPQIKVQFKRLTIFSIIILWILLWFEQMYKGQNSIVCDGIFYLYTTLIMFYSCYILENELLYNNGPIFKFPTIQLEVYRSSSSRIMAIKWISNGRLQWEWACILLFCIRRNTFCDNCEISFPNKIWETASQQSFHCYMGGIHSSQTQCVLNTAIRDKVYHLSNNIVKMVHQTFTHSP
jgi:hypothetical protein